MDTFNAVYVQIVS